MSLSTLKQADDRTKCIIFGYSRQSAKALAVNIPLMMQYLFLKYYWIQEKLKLYGSGLLINEQGEIKDRFSGPSYEYKYNTVYGNNIIDFKDTSITRYQWSFKILKFEHYVHNFVPVCVGIDSSDNKHINDDFGSQRVNRSKFYAIGSNSYLYRQHLGPRKILSGFQWKNHDIIHFILDVDDTKFSMKLQRDNKPAVQYLFVTIQRQKTRYGADIFDKWNLALTMPIQKDIIVQFIDFKTFQKV